MRGWIDLLISDFLREIGPRRKFALVVESELSWVSQIY